MSLNNKYEYVAIDFETANANLTSACSIGIACAKNNRIVKETYFLINPNEPFLEYNILIHGITPDMVCNQPTFDVLWDEIKGILDNEIVIAHNAGFDIAVLKSLLDKYDLEYPNILIGDTLRVSKIAFKDILPNCKLNTISNYLEVCHNHHNAQSDALVCFYLIERCKKIYSAIDIMELFEIINLGFGMLNPKIYRGCFNKYTQISKSQVENNRLAGEIFAFTGKPKTMTKQEAKNLVLISSGVVSKDINLGITSFVIFTNPVKKHLSCLEKIKEHKNIKVYNEEEFRSLVIK